MILKRLGVLSCGKMLGGLYAVLGLITGIVLSPLLHYQVRLLWPEMVGPVILLCVLGAVVLLPLLAGVVGFLNGTIIAAVYNVVARVFGGIEVDLR